MGKTAAHAINFYHDETPTPTQAGAGEETNTITFDAPKESDMADMDDNRLLFDDPTSRQVGTSVTAGSAGGGGAGSRRKGSSKVPTSAVNWKMMRHAVVEVPMTVRMDDESSHHVSIRQCHPGPHTRLSTSTTVPIIASLPQLSARLAATAVTHGAVGNIHHDVAVQYRHSITPTTSTVLKTTTTAGIKTVRNRRRPHIQLQAQLVPSQSSPQSQKSRPLPTTLTARYTHPSLINWAIPHSPHDVPLSLSLRKPVPTLAGTVAVQCQPSLWKTTASSLSLAWEAATIHPWCVQVGLRWKNNNDEDDTQKDTTNPLLAFTWRASTTPHLSKRHKLRVAVHGSTSGNNSSTTTDSSTGWLGGITLHWVQRLRHNVSLGLGLTLSSSSATTASNSVVPWSKAQWLVVWQHGDFVVRVPILWGSSGASTAWWTSVVWASVSSLVHAAVMALWEMMTSDKKGSEDPADVVAAQQQQRQEYITAARTRAQQQQDLMQRQADVRQRDSGLVIHMATYYIPQSSDPLEEWDVTTPLQFWVTSNGILELPAGSSKGSLLGFVDLASLSKSPSQLPSSFSQSTVPMDPLFSWAWWTAFGRSCPAATSITTPPPQPPRLCVVYEYCGQRHEIHVNDTERLVLPVT